MLGYERGDLVSARLCWTDLMPPEWHDADKLQVERVKRIGRLQPFEKEFFRKDGSRIPWNSGALGSAAAVAGNDDTPRILLRACPGCG